MTVAGSGKDFFISYANVNELWAKWIAVELQRAGFSTVVQAWDFRPGTDFAFMMQEAMSSASRTIAVLSPAYLASRFAGAEWRAAFVKDPTGELGLLIPALVQPCELPGVLASRVYVDLTEVDEAVARKKLLAAVDRQRPRPVSAVFPGAAAAVNFPGDAPRVSNIPMRDRNFTGRAEVLLQLYDDLRVDAAAAVHGLGGVGKSTMVVEFAHRYASDYEVIWWIDAEQTSGVVASLETLAGELGLAVSGDERDAVAAVFAELRRRERWLLIYDNAESPEGLAELLPAGGGHVLVTSRWPAWGDRASPVPLPVWSRAESVEFLRARTRRADVELLGEVAELVGDLPLALGEAAAYLEETGEDLGVYLGLLRERARELFGLREAAQSTEIDRDRRRAATVWTVSLERVHDQEPRAEDLMNLLAFMAPRVPRDLPALGRKALPEPLAHAVEDRLVYNRLLKAVGRYALVSLDATAVDMHRLVQAVVQARLDQPAETFWAATALDLVRAVFPSESGDIGTWPRCELLLPHLLAVTSHALRLGVGAEQCGWLFDRASRYLRGRGQYREAEPLARQAVAITEAAVGPDHPDVAWRRDELGSVLESLGEFVAAREQLDLAIQIGEAALGPDHQDIGEWRNDLGNVLYHLGRFVEARDQYEHALRISEPALGPDHLEIGMLRNNLGTVLGELEEFAAAREQLDEALQISESALGLDHPNVGVMHNNLGTVLHGLGQLAAAREQYEQALRISESALGPDHPEIGIRRGNLGYVLRDMGHLDAAREQLESAVRISHVALGPDHQQTRAIRGELESLIESGGGGSPPGFTAVDREGGPGE